MKIIKQLETPSVPSDINPNYPWGVITFIYNSSGSTLHRFYTGFTRSGKERVCVFNDLAPAMDIGISQAKSIFNVLRKKATIIGYIGTEHFV